MVGQNAISGLVQSPSEADEIDIFNFGQYFEYDYVHCEADCEANPGCVAYSQFPNFYPNVDFTD